MNPSIRSVLLAGIALAALTTSTALAAFQAAKPLRQPAPAYDYQLKKQNIEGAVIISLDINAEGSVSHATVLASSDHAFEAATLDAVYKWRFSPARQDDKAMAIKALQLITFNIEEQNTSTANLLAKVRSKPGASPLPADKLVDLVSNSPVGQLQTLN